MTGTLSGVVAGDNITVSYSTTAGQFSHVGSDQITATLIDPSGRLSNYNVTNTSGTLTVTPATMDPISDQTILESFVSGTQYTVTITGITSGQALNISATSNNTSCVPNPSVVYATGNTATLTYSSTAYTWGDATITVSLQASDGSTVAGDTISQSFVVHVTRPSVTLTGSVAGVTTTSVAEASVYTVTLGPVVDPLRPSDPVVYYLIHWGDSSNVYVSSAGSTGNGSGSNASNLMAMPGNRQFTHTYADGTVPLGTTTPTNTISVDLLDNDGYWSSVGSSGVVVYDVPPTAGMGVSTPVNEGTTGATVTFFNQNDVSAVDRAAGYTYRYDFNNDGIWDTAVTSNASVTIPASFLSVPGNVTVRGRIIDKDGGYTDYTQTIQVLNVAPVVNAGSGATMALGVSSLKVARSPIPGWIRHGRCTSTTPTMPRQIPDWARSSRAARRRLSRSATRTPRRARTRRE